MPPLALPEQPLLHGGSSSSLPPSSSVEGAGADQGAAVVIGATVTSMVQVCVVLGRLVSLHVETLGYGRDPLCQLRR